MSILPVLQHPDKRLRQKATPVTTFGATTQAIIRDMFETLYKDEVAAGYAAPQMNHHQQIITIDLSPNRNEPLCLVNPTLIEQSKELATGLEACMSVPGGIAENVTRPACIKVAAYDAKGKRFELECDGFLAKCVQHEIDHLNGILFIDHLSPLKRQRIAKKIAKWHKEHQE